MNRKIMLLSHTLTMRVSHVASLVDFVCVEVLRPSQPNHVERGQFT